MIFSHVLPLFASQWRSLLQRKPGIIITNFGPAAVASKALSDLHEALQINENTTLANKHLTDTIEELQLKETEASNLRDALVRQNITLQNELVKKEAFVQRLFQEHKTDMDEQQVRHENEIARLRNQLSAENHTRLHLALVEAKVEHANEYRKALKSVQDQKRSLRISQNIANDQRKRAEQLATSLAECKAKLVEMETINHQLDETLHTQLQELDDSRDTVGRMRAFYAILLEKRDDQILGLQERIEQLEEASDDDIGQVSPNYYKILGVERHSGTNDLKSAYRAKCLTHHPDKHRDSPDQDKHEAIFKTLTYGFEVLNHPTSRGKYDEWLDMEGVRLAHHSYYCSF